MSLDGITFDESDKNLFLVDDARLRADALKHSVLPRMHVVINECISAIRNAYDIEALDDSIISYFPQFRPKRTRELELKYDTALVGLAGKRVTDKWLGFERKNGKPVQFLPFRLGLQLTEDGLSLWLQNYWLTGLSDESYKKLFAFHLEHESLIHTICYICSTRPILYYGEDAAPLMTFRELYEFMMKHRVFDNDFRSTEFSFPIAKRQLSRLINRFTLFFPVYDSYIQIAKGQPIRFRELIDKANAWLRKQDDSEGNGKQEKQGHIPEDIRLRAAAAADQKVRVMPALRWQVFQRDNWKCVSCGRGSQEDAILHVDHILPRSKGGSDSLNNYQTLCHLCNIGKGNRDDTNLRGIG